MLKVEFIKMKYLFINGYYEEGEKPTHLMGENIC